NVGGEVLRLSRGEIDVGKAVKFGVFVGGDVDAFAVFAEGAPRVMDLVFRFRIGRGESSFLAARCVDEVEITFVGGDFFDSEEFATVRRPGGDGPAAAGVLCQEPIGFRIARVHHVEVDVIASASG